MKKILTVLATLAAVTLVGCSSCGNPCGNPCATPCNNPCPTPCEAPCKAPCYKGER